MNKKSFVNEKINPQNKFEEEACTYIILSAMKNKIKSVNQLHRLKNKACEKYNVRILTNPMLLRKYNELVSSKKIISNNNIFQLLRKRKIRSSSGVVAVAVLTKPYTCPGKCLFCPTQKDVPKSYIDNEPAVMRAILAGYDPIKQVSIRLRGLEISGNPADKIELIVMGGTFSYLPRAYQIKFIIGCFMTCNTYDSKLGKDANLSKIKLKFLSLPNNILQLKRILKLEQIKNERAKYRIIGLTLETRPDYISKEELDWFRILGCTRVEMGVQSIYDSVLNINKRGHDNLATISATKLLKDAGFKINYHMMPNLYGSNKKKDLDMFKKLFISNDYQPDMLKIYPCVITKYSPYLKLYYDKKYKPYTDLELTNLITNIKKNIPHYVRIQRLIRDIPSQNIIGSSKISNLRQIIHNNNKNICKCIRCREIRNDFGKNVYLNRFDYEASGGKEIFLQYIDESNRLYALLRIRIPSQLINNKKHWIRELTGCAIIREVHTYGSVVKIGEMKKSDKQHKGLGRKLIKQAEKIIKKEYCATKLAVISGIGVRGYYRKLGFELDGTYMVKKI